MESGWEEAVVNLTKEETQKNSNLRIKMVMRWEWEKMREEREEERREEMIRKGGGKRGKKVKMEVEKIKYQE